MCHTAAVVDRPYADVSHAAVYDVLNRWGPCDDFYLDLVMAAPSVLDVGCGTGRLLHGARAAGHEGRLVGLDPAAAMLVRARDGRRDVEWVLGDLRSHAWHGEFGLVVMTGHAFQELLGDEELRLALRAVREALGDGGRFVFETRNPAARAWEAWTPKHVRELDDGQGGRVRVWHEVEGPLHGDRVTFTTTCEFTTPFGDRRLHASRVSRNTLRFLDATALAKLLAEAGLTVTEQYGDWGRGPLGPGAPEIITVTRAV